MRYYSRLRDMREDHDLTQAELADKIGISQVQYSRYESGVQQIPVHHVIALAKIYNVSIDYLAGLINDPRPLYPK